LYKDFTSYQQALELKQLGFNELCFATIDQTEFVHIKGTKYPAGCSMMYDTIDCPTFSQAFRWFKKMYDLQCWNEPSGSDRYICRYDGNDENGYRWVGYLRNIHNEILYFSNYEEAELECLKKLIEIVKNK